MFSWVRQIGKAFGIRALSGFEAAKTNRLTGEHFPTSESKINDDLFNDLPRLRARTLHEIKNNPFLAGVVDTHKTDVVGPEGPSLQLTSTSDRFNREIEESWQEWFASPDVTGLTSGAESLQQDIGMLWGCGEFLHQLTMDAESETALQFRTASIHPRRLDNPAGAAWSDDIMLGVRRNRFGKPKGYFITDFNVDEGFSPLSYNQREIPASQIIHGYKQSEPGQVRGYPWASSALQIIADLRDYDASVLRAARIAAELSVLLYTDHPDVTPLNVNESVEFESNVIRTMIPGWKPMQVKSEQPTTNYVDFRTERIRELGRPINMPLMMVKLDSQAHSYSSARFDGQVYNRGVKALQAFLSRKKLDRCLGMVMRESLLVKQLSKPRKVTWKWTWPVSPHVDPQKEAQAIETLLNLGLISEYDAAAMIGKDYETVTEQRRRAKQLREKIDGNENSDNVDTETKEKVVRACLDALGAKSGESVVMGELAL